MTSAGERSGLKVHPLFDGCNALGLLRRDPWYEILKIDRGSIVEAYSLRRADLGVGDGVPETGVRKPDQEIIAFGFRFLPHLGVKDGIVFFRTAGVALVANERNERVDVLVSGTYQHRGWVDVSVLDRVSPGIADMPFAKRVREALINHRKIWSVTDHRFTQGPDGYREIPSDHPDAVLFQGLRQPPIDPAVARILG